MLERISVMGKKSLSTTAQSFGRRADVRVQSVVTCHNSAHGIMARDVSSLPMFYQMPPARGGEGGTITCEAGIRTTLNGPQG